MSKQWFFAGVSFVVLAMLAVIPSKAQIPPGTGERAVIPFDFIVRGRTLPAGTYTIRRVNDLSDVLLIESRNLQSHVFFETEPLRFRNEAERSELIFHRYGDTCFLREIRIAVDDEGRGLATSRAEKVLQRESASNTNMTSTTVAVELH